MVINDLIGAVNSRRSCRAFEDKVLKEREVESLLEAYHSIVLPFQHDVEMLPFITECSRKMYTSFTAPPCGIAFCANCDIISQTKVGFLGELLILCATAKNFGTCWIGHFNNEILSNCLSKYSNIAVDVSKSFGFSQGTTGKMPLCITPIGYEGKKNLGHKIMSSFGSRRKKLEDVVDENTNINLLSEEVKRILSLAIIAPSALNMQPWTFNVSQDNKKISVYLSRVNKLSKWNHPNLDIGIAACHIWLALQAQGKRFDVRVQENSGCVTWEFAIQ